MNTDKEYRAVISTGPTAADEQAIIVHAVNYDSAMKKVKKYCKDENLYHPSIALVDITDW